MTLKMARWFEVAGRPPLAQSSRVDGRKWIESVKLALKRAKEVETDFDALQVKIDACMSSKRDSHDSSYEGMLEARHARRIATARDEEERSWMVRHKPKSAGLSLSSASWKGPTCKRDANHQNENQSDIGLHSELSQGMRMREEALRLPVGDTNLASRPSHTRCGAILYKGGPFKEKRLCSISDSADTGNAGSTPRAHTPALSDCEDVGKALELWGDLRNWQSNETPKRAGRSKCSEARVQQILRKLGKGGNETSKHYEMDPMRE